MKGENKLVVLAVRLAADIALISLSLVDFLLSRVGKCGVACLFSVLTYWLTDVQSRNVQSCYYMLLCLLIFLVGLWWRPASSLAQNQTTSCALFWRCSKRQMRNRPALLSAGCAFITSSMVDLPCSLAVLQVFNISSPLLPPSPRTPTPPHPLPTSPSRLRRQLKQEGNCCV